MDRQLRLVILAGISLSAFIYALSHQPTYDSSGRQLLAGDGAVFLAPLLFVAIVVPLALIAKDLADKFNWR